MMRMIVNKREEESNAMLDTMMTRMMNKWMKVMKVRLEDFWPSMKEITKMTK